jgi:hypothetical protein
MNPRPTPAMLKTAVLASEKFTTLLADAEILGKFLLFAYATLKRLEIQHPVRDRVEEVLRSRGQKFALEAGEDEMIFALELLDTIKARRPDVYHIIGERLGVLQGWTFMELVHTAPDQSARDALHQAAIAAMPPTIELEHLPDNPISVNTDLTTGAPYLTNVEEATIKHYMQIHAYQRSMQPGGPVGRPKGQAKAPKSGKPSVDPGLALRVYQAKLDGQNWQQVARRVLHEPIPTDPKARERLRGRIRYLEAIGLRLYRKKSG